MGGRRVKWRGREFLAASALSILISYAGCATSAQAQTQLPGIVVTTPSPVVRPRRPIEFQPQAEPTESAPQINLQNPRASIVAVDDAFVPVTVVTERELFSNQGSTITDTLQTKPGISGSTFAPGANRPVIRGLDDYRVRTQENGIGTQDVSALSEDHAIPVDPFAAERVEVVRGPATLRYGSQAIGGVVGVENNRIPAFAPPRGFTAEMKGGLSLVDDGRDGAFSVTAGSGHFVVHGDGFRRKTGDYDTPQGKQLNSFVDSEGYALGTSYVGNRGFVGVAFSHFTSVYGIPGAEAAIGRPRIDMQQDKLLSKGEWRVHDHGVEAIRFWFGSSRYAHNEIDFNAEEAVDEVGSRFTNKEQEGRLEVQHLPVHTTLGELRGTIGGQWGHRNVSGVSFEGDSLLDPARAIDVAGFIFEQLELTKRLTLQAAARIEQSNVRGTGLKDPLDAPLAVGIERTFTARSASLGALYELPLGVVARVIGQYVERAPDAAELFSKGVHDATGTFELGNPDLATEKARTIEFGLKRAKGDLRFDSGLYYTRFEGFIFKSLTGVECDATLASCGDGDPDNQLKQLLFEQRDAAFYGAEVAVQYDVAPIWRGVWGVEGQYDFVRARFEGDGNVPRIPPHRLGGGLFYRDNNWFARTGVLHAFRQDEIAENETPTSSYTLVSMELSYIFRLGPQGSVVPEWTIGLKGENLLDDDVRNAVSFKKDEVLLPGRSIRLFGSIKLN